MWGFFFGDLCFLCFMILLLVMCYYDYVVFFKLLGVVLALSLCCCLTCWHWVCAAQSRVLAQSLCCHVVLTQDCAHRVLFVSGSVTGTSPTNSLSGLASLQTLGNNNFSSVSPGVTTNGLGGTSAPSGMDALSQAYSGIQQYAGLSSLLSPAGKGWWIFFISGVWPLCCSSCASMTVFWRRQSYLPLAILVRQTQSLVYFSRHSFYSLYPMSAMTLR